MVVSEGYLWGYQRAQFSSGRDDEMYRIEKNCSFIKRECHCVSMGLTWKRTGAS